MAERMEMMATSAAQVEGDSSLEAVKKMCSVSRHGKPPKFTMCISHALARQ